MGCCCCCVGKYKKKHFQCNMKLAGQDDIALEIFETLNMDSNDIDHLYYSFCQIDQDFSGAIKQSELFTFLEIEFGSMEEKIFSAIDEDSNGLITFSEFVCNLWNLLTLREYDLAYMAFLLGDHTGQQELTFDKVRSVFECVHRKHINKDKALASVFHQFEVETLAKNYTLVPMEYFRSWCEQNPSFLHPLLSLQYTLRRKLGGELFWVGLTDERYFTSDKHEKSNIMWVKKMYKEITDRIMTERELARIQQIKNGLVGPNGEDLRDVAQRKHSFMLQHFKLTKDAAVHAADSEAAGNAYLAMKLAEQQQNDLPSSNLNNLRGGLTNELQHEDKYSSDAHHHHNHHHHHSHHGYNKLGKSGHKLEEHALSRTHGHDDGHVPPLNTRHNEEEEEEQQHITHTHITHHLIHHPPGHVPKHGGAMSSPFVDHSAEEHQAKTIDVNLKEGHTATTEAQNENQNEEEKDVVVATNGHAVIKGTAKSKAGAVEAINDTEAAAHNSSADDVRSINSRATPPPRTGGSPFTGSTAQSSLPIAAVGHHQQHHHNHKANLHHDQKEIPVHNQSHHHKKEGHRQHHHHNEEEHQHHHYNEEEHQRHHNEHKQTFHKLPRPDRYNNHHNHDNLKDPENHHHLAEAVHKGHDGAHVLHLQQEMRKKQMEELEGTL